MNGDHKQRASLPPIRKKAPRLAAGRARALGLPTRGTTNANRLRRVDRWLLATQVPRLRDAARPLVVDLGYGSSAVTTLELVERLGAEVEMIGRRSALAEATSKAAALALAEMDASVGASSSAIVTASSGVCGSAGSGGGGSSELGHAPVIRRYSSQLLVKRPSAVPSLSHCSAAGGTLVP